MPRKPRSPALDSLLASMEAVPDPRVAARSWHPLVNVLTMAFLGVICGCDGWEALELYAESHAEWLATFLDMPHGPPSADTFRRVFEALDPGVFQDAFRRWLKPLLENLEGQTICMDGKTLRGALSHAARSGGAFHLMHVWAGGLRLLLGQKAVEGAGGEVDAALELLAMLDLRGAPVTADANSCTASVTNAVRDRGGDFVLALKGNRAALHEHVEQLFAKARETGFEHIKAHCTDDVAHGRIEFRQVRAIPMGKLPPHIKADWRDLNTAVLVERVRTTDHTSLELAYYVTSHRPDPELLAGHIRGHWSIENQLHHSLDVSFADDRRSIRHDNGAQNFALLARHALSLFKREPAKLSVAMKRRKAAWSGNYVLDLLKCGFAEV